jgi:hypothetical protein
MPKTLGQPIHGFAKRADDTVARAMAILNSRLNTSALAEEGSPLGRRSQDTT